MEELLVSEFKENVLYRLDESSRMINKALKDVSESQIWERPNAISNSIGNLILHLCGNITQYVISSLGEAPDLRDRDAEFAALEGVKKHELQEKLSITVKEAKSIIQNSSKEQLIRKRNVQGFNFSGIGIVIHVVEHYSYHTGQIAFWVKQLQERDLGFYDDCDLNIKNEE